ncbi:MAG: hypothetical protein Q9220_007366 [cf. Caloplaca sp. 1 TL-2023]
MAYEAELARSRVQDNRTAGDIPMNPPRSPNSIPWQEGFTMQKFRVGCPALQILPLEYASIDRDDPILAILNEQRAAFGHICTARGIVLRTDTPVTFQHRVIPGSAPRSDTMTVFVTAVWEQGCGLLWLQAASEIRGMLRANPMTRSVQVEMISWQLTRRRIEAPLEESHPINGHWPKLRLQIHDVLNQSPALRDSCSIFLHRRGYDAREHEGDPSPFITTILVVVDYDVDPWQWEEQEHQIIQLLAAFRMEDVKVEFERGGNWSGSDYD